MQKLTDKRVQYLRNALDYSAVELMGRTLASIREYDVNTVAEDDPLKMLAYMDELLGVLDSAQDVGDYADADCDLLMLLNRVAAYAGPVLRGG